MNTVKLYDITNDDNEIIGYAYGPSWEVTADDGTAISDTGKTYKLPYRYTVNDDRQIVTPDGSAINYWDIDVHCNEGVIDADSNPHITDTKDDHVLYPIAPPRTIKLYPVTRHGTPDHVDATCCGHDEGDDGFAPEIIDYALESGTANRCYRIRTASYPIWYLMPSTHPDGPHPSITIKTDNLGPRLVSDSSVYSTTVIDGDPVIYNRSSVIRLQLAPMPPVIVRIEAVDTNDYRRGGFLVDAATQHLGTAFDYYDDDCYELPYGYHIERVEIGSVEIFDGLGKHCEISLHSCGRPQLCGCNKCLDRA